MGKLHFLINNKNKLIKIDALIVNGLITFYVNTLIRIISHAYIFVATWPKVSHQIKVKVKSSHILFSCIYQTEILILQPNPSDTNCIIQAVDVYFENLVL